MEHSLGAAFYGRGSSGFQHGRGQLTKDPSHTLTSLLTMFDGHTTPQKERFNRHGRLMESDSTSFSLHTGELDGRIDLTAQAREMLDLELAEAQGKVTYGEGTSPPGVRKLCVIVGSEKSKDERFTTQDLECHTLLVAPSDDLSTSSY
ncbi:hypothetical protein CEK26_012614 [Fusarium fujikuroi]|uniref:Uncharacterized protein n=1 Tax=Fusarium fujikuroi TaxID=5127 RepID=A0A5Q3F3C1_FUSFU|nr:hypothetical protein CEK27_012626 [Fusarium fujikuroi]QGI85846.1 hypothetical protein CEK25_012575 [Fusarium fujikuroi]QGI99545.1 hypothetical protein CEK26_012614 [Fusarium fujikuroi]VTT59632.1 unnamed protein product [Fusarium fujikuroi]VTT62123.1 unnamed protein product [Fusarium fujikuroi]